jgi:hypothetical protein
MADSPVFNVVAEGLERDTSLDRLEARGTLRLALKSSGLEPRDITAEQMKVVLRRVLPEQLATRGVTNGADLCERMVAAAADADTGEKSGEESPDAIFARLGA